MKNKPLVLAASIAALLSLPVAPPRARAQQFWDGANTVANNIVDGGNGTWNNTLTNWTNVAGTTNSPYSSGVSGSNFSGTAGTVTLGENIVMSSYSLQFSTDGYVIEPNGFSIDIGSSAGFVMVDPGVTARINAPLTGTSAASSLRVSGPGILILGGANAYAGITSIFGGTLRAGAVNTLPTTNLIDFSSGARLELNGFSQAIGGLYSAGTSNRSIHLDGGATLTLGNGNFSMFFVNGPLDFGGTIAGNGGLTKVGTGTQILSGDNLYTGLTRVNDGTLAVGGLVAPTDDPFLPAGVIIGDGIGAARSAIFRNDQAARINDNAPVTVNADGLFNVNGLSEEVGNVTIDRGIIAINTENFPIAGFEVLVVNNLTMTGGAVNGTGAARLVLGGSVAATSDAAGNAAAISSTVNLNGASRTFTVNPGSGATQLVISGTINEGTNLDPFATGGTATAGIVKAGAGTLVLSGANTYNGATAINGGVLSVSSDGNLGAAPFAPAANHLTFDNGGTLQATGSFALDSDRGITLNALGGTIGVTGAAVLTYDGVITGAGSLTKSDTGTLVLSGANSYAGNTTVNAGVLSAGAANTLPSLTALGVVGGATFDLNSFDQTVGSLTTGTGNITLGTATLTTGSANTNASFGGSIGGAGGLTKVGSGSQTLTGASGYTGATTVSGGALIVNGSLANTPTTVQSGATLGGSGGIGGAVTIQSGGILAPGGAPGTLTLGSLILNAGAFANYELGTAGVIGGVSNDLTTVTGALTLDGTLNVANLGSFGSGSYRLFSYGGALTNSTLDIGSVPVGFTYSIVTGVPNVVDLVVTGGVPTTQFWDGTGPFGNSVINGGNGNWDNFTANWTNATGATNSAWQNGNAVFGGTAGTVTLAAPISVAGLTFSTSGYILNGAGANVLNLVGSPSIAVANASTATINAQIAGSGRISKDDAGTVIFGGTNTYSGGTTFNAGTLGISADANLGAAPGAATAGHLAFNGGTLRATGVFTLNSNRGITLGTGGGNLAVPTGSTLTYGGAIAGSGALTKSEPGTLVLTGVSTYSGATNIAAGTLRAGALNVLDPATAVTVAAGATFDLAGFDQFLVGSLAGGGNVTLGTAQLGVGGDDTNTDFSGVISGTGLLGLAKFGSGTQTLSGLNTYTGQTNVSTGTLRAGVANALPLTSLMEVSLGATLDLNGFNQQVGSLVSSGTIALGGATLEFGNDNLSTFLGQPLSFGGVISGAGAVTKVGTGAQIFAGANSYSGNTTVSAGILRAGAINTLPSQTALRVVSGATFDLNSFNQSIGSLTTGSGTITLGNATLTIGNANTNATFGGAINGAGGLTKVGSGTQTFTGTSTYDGPTTVSAGALIVNGALGNTATTVQSGATLGGTGSITGGVTIAAGGILAPGGNPGTFTVGSLTLSPGAISNYELATFGTIGSGINDLTVVNGNLTLDGTLNVTGLTGFGTGLYRLFNFGGTLTNNTLDIGTVPAGFSLQSFGIVIAPGEVSLLVGDPTARQYWDGANLTANGAVDGGTGTWNNSATNWTTETGTPNSAWMGGQATFRGTAGTVTIAESIFTSGLIFETSGYVLNASGGSSLNLISPAVIGANTGTATINAPIGGTGGLTSTGAGVLVLGGTNTYSGITRINTGTVSISSDANLGAAPGAPVANQLTLDGGTLQATATFTLNPNRGLTLLAGGGTVGVATGSTLSYAGAITGTGASGLTKAGGGTLLLSGAQKTYTGATTVGGGTLRAGSVNVLPAQTALTVATNATFDLNGLNQRIGGLSGSGGVTLGAGSAATTLTFGNGSGSFGGAISGTGGLTKDGTGVQTLTGASTYTGATNIITGTLVAASQNPNTLPAQTTLNVAANGTFTLNGGNQAVASLTGAGTINLLQGVLTTGSSNTDTTYSGLITGPGGLGKTGTGVFTLTRENTYTGPTSITGGTLRAGIANAISPASAVGVGAGATFDLNDLPQSIGPLSGAGAVALGTATLTSSTPNGSEATFSGVISGSGGLLKLGEGTQILTGNNLYRGDTSINAGTLQVDGAIASANSYINPGGRLTGRGIIGGNVTNEGQVRPGNAGQVGTLTVNGNYVQKANGSLTIKVAGAEPGQHDVLAVKGRANLDGELRITQVGGARLKLGDKLNIVTAERGVTGQFATVDNAFDSLIGTTLSYLPNGVTLETGGGSGGLDLPPDPISDPVRKVLIESFGDPRMEEVFEYLSSLPASSLPAALRLIAPDEIAAAQGISSSVADIQNNNVQRRMEGIRSGSFGFSAAGFAVAGLAPTSGAGFSGAAGPRGEEGKPMEPTPTDYRWGTFITGVGEIIKVGDTDRARGYDLNTGGFTLGVDYKVTPNFTLGLIGGYARTGTDLADGGDIEVDGVKYGLYGTFFSGGAYVDAALHGGYNSYETKRTALGGNARGDTDGGEFNLLFAPGYDWQKGALTLGVTSSFQYTYVKIDGFTEKGSLLPLQYKTQETESLRTSLGVKASYDLKVGSKILRPEVRVGWQHEFGEQTVALDSRFANGAGGVFKVVGPEIGRDSLLLGAGAALIWSDRVSAYLYYDGEFGRTNYDGHNFTGGVRMSF